MIQFKIFKTQYRKTADEFANEWLAENPNIKIIDYRYQIDIAASNDSYYGSSRERIQAIFLVYETA